ncbi:hypothetical protein [Aeoliella sp. SH292]|uniref:hypothetical protein n=1 Tax=Aeoliella sp. SH292 TaxID=3454464 RepID=UPI003F9B4DFD
MRTPPTREEILAKYRDVIAEEEFEVLVAESPPSPAEMQPEGAWLQILGPVGDWFVVLKRKLHGPVVAIALFGSVCSGLEYALRVAVFTHDSVKSIVTLAQEHLDQPANSYAFILPDDDSKPKPDYDWYDLPPGTGVTSFNADWGLYS